MGDILETAVELIVAEFVVLITGFTGPHGISDEISTHLIHTAFSGFLRPVR
jgi:hypothetical protein